MGNNIGRSKKAKIMKVSGETFKLKTPAQAQDVLKDYPGYVLLDSEAVKHFGVRANPLQANQELKPKKIYFLVELPKFPDEKEPRARRVRSSGIHMSAKDRLECLMLSRRSASDLALVRSSSASASELQGGNGGLQVKLRLPRSQVEKLVKESRDGVEVAEKIVDLYMESSSVAGQQGQWKPELSSIGENFKAHDKKQVSFLAEEEKGEIQLAVASH